MDVGAYGYVPEELQVGDVVRIQLMGFLKRGCLGVLGLIDSDVSMPYRYRVDIDEEEFYRFSRKDLEFIARPQVHTEEWKD